MSLKAKKTRRWVLLLAGVATLGGLVGGGYYLRVRHLDRRLRADYAAGREALAAGDHEAALHKIGAYLQRHADDAAAMYEYARAREHVEEPNGKHVGQAIRLYVRLLDLEPNHLEARRRLLDLYVRSRFNAEALQAADELLARAPDDPAAYRAKAVASARLSRNDQALKFAERFNELAPKDLPGQVMTLQLMQRCGRSADEVRRRPATLRGDNPADPRWDLLSSIAAGMTDDAEGAGSWARRAAANPQLPPDVVVPLAEQLNLLGAFDAAMEVLRRGAEADPASEAVALLAARLWENGRWQEVEDHLRTLGADRAAATELLALRAMSLAELGRASEAQPLLAELAARPLDPAAVAWAQVIPAATSGNGKPSPAAGAERKIIAACESALRQRPNHPYFHYFLGEAYARIGDSQLALEHWREAFRSAPAWPKPLTRVSRDLLAAGLPAEARSVAQVAVQRHPRDPAARAALGWAWAETLASPADAEALLKFIDETRAVASNDEEASVLRVAVLAAAGRREAAVAAARGLLAAKDAPPAPLLIRMAQVSERAGLGLEGECFERCLRAHGPTPVLALARATSLLRAGRRDEGVRVIREGPAAGGIRDGSWRVAEARYLDLARDASAGGTWAALAEAHPDDVAVLWSAFASPSLSNDPKRRGAILERLRGPVGDLGLNWRLARAAFLLEGQPSTQDVAEATALLGEVTRAMPALVPPRLLLADALTKSGETDRAVEQLAAVVHLNPQAVSASLGLAELLQSKGEFGRAGEHLRGVLGSTHARDADKQLAATLLARQGESGPAVEVLEQLLAGGDARHGPALVLASLYRARNEPAKAEEVYVKLMATPDAAVVQEAASFYASGGRAKEARATLARLDALKVAPVVKELVRGVFEARHGDHRVALKHFEAAVAADPGSAAAWQQLVTLHVAAGRPDEAAKAIERAAQAAPDARVLAGVRRHRQLVADFAADPAARPLVLALLRPEQADVAAKALSMLGGRGEAGESAERSTVKLAELANRHPQMLPLQSLLVQQYLGQRRFDDAVKVASRTMHLLRSAAEPARLTAEALAAAGRWEEALAAAHKWRERSVTQPLRADLLIAAIDIRLGQADRAASRLEPHVALALSEPESGLPVIVLAARARAAGGKLGEAEHLVGPMLPRSARWRVAWAELAADARVPSRAGAAWLDRLTTLVDPASPEEAVAVAQAWHVISRRTKDPADTRKAVQWRERAAALVRSDAVPKAGTAAVLALAFLHEESRELAAAEEFYRRVLRINPDVPEALNNLAMLLLARDGKSSEAASLATRAVQLAPHVPNLHDTLATIQVRERQYDQALASLNTALRLDPKETKWRVHLAAVLVEAGRPKDARAQLEQIDSRHPGGAGLPAAVRERLRLLREVLRAKT